MNTENPRLLSALALVIGAGIALWFALPLPVDGKVPLFGLLGLGVLPLSAWIAHR